jgi:hypothetical protein
MDVFDGSFKGRETIASVVPELMTPEVQPAALPPSTLRLHLLPSGDL